MNNVLSKVFVWMFVGLLITFITGYVVSVNPNMLANVFSSGMYMILIIVEFLLVIILSARVSKMNPTTARIMFMLYSFVTGLTFSSIFVVYQMSSIMIVFLVASLMFGIFGFIGYTANTDLTKIGTYLFVGLIAIIISTIINMFIGNGMFEIIICSISILIFLGFTVYDIQKIKALESIIDEDNLAIYGALQLYLDFINIFIDLLRLFGNSRD